MTKKSTPIPVEHPELFLHANGHEIVNPATQDVELPADVSMLLEGMKQTKQEARVSKGTAHEPTIGSSNSVALQGVINFGSSSYQERPEGRRVAFGRYLKAWQYDRGHEISTAILTEKEKDWITPESLLQELFTDTSPGKPKPDGLFIDGVLLNQYEYKLIPRSPDALGRASISKTLGDKDVAQEVVNSANRSRLHTFETKVEVLTLHEAKLADRAAQIKELQRLAKRPGHAVVDPETMKQLLSGAWNELHNMLDAIQIKNSWSDEDRQVAEASLLYYLTSGKQNIRVQKWGQMLDVVSKYLHARKALVGDRKIKTQRLHDQYAKQSA